MRADGAFMAGRLPVAAAIAAAMVPWSLLSAPISLVLKEGSLIGLWMARSLKQACFTILYCASAAFASIGTTFEIPRFDRMTFSQSPWSRCIASPSAPPPDDEDEDEDEEEELNEDPRGRRFRAVTMSSKHALKPDGNSESESEPEPEPEPEPATSCISKPGSMSEYKNVTRPFNARPDASLTVIFDSLPSGVSVSDATPLGEQDSAKEDSVEVDSVEVVR